MGEASVCRRETGFGNPNPDPTHTKPADAETGRRVKRWRHESMVLRRAGSALLWVGRGFRRIRGHRALPSLIKSLQTLPLNNLTLDKRARAA